MIKRNLTKVPRQFNEKRIIFQHKLRKLDNHMEKNEVGGDPVVKTLPSNAEGRGLIPCGEAKIPHASWPKIQNINRSNTVTKTSKTVHIKTNKQTNKNELGSKTKI